VLNALIRLVVLYNDQPLKKSDKAVEQAIEKLAHRHPSWGFCKIYYRLRKDGLAINHKRLWGVSCHLRLNLPRKKKKPLPSKQPLTLPAKAHQMWSMDGMLEVLTDGRCWPTLNVMQDYNPAALALEIDCSLPARPVMPCLEQLLERHGPPTSSRCDKGPDRAARAVLLAVLAGSGVRVKAASSLGYNRASPLTTLTLSGSMVLSDRTC
jgi:putative transposase